MVQVYNNGAPLQVRVYNTPVSTDASLNDDLGIFVQDSWRIRRLTVNPGLRWEQLREEVNAQSAPAGRFVGPRSFDAIENLPNFKNFVPRVGAAYDLFGDGTTGIKGSVGRMQQDASSFARHNRWSRRRALWTDSNGDDIAEGSTWLRLAARSTSLKSATFGAPQQSRSNLSRPISPTTTSASRTNSSLDSVWR
jgi:hypothetical protein